MAGSVNKVILVGNLGKDPEQRSFQNGGSVVNFSLATSEAWTDRASGERKEKVEWHNVVVKNDKLAEIAMKYLKKGAKVYLEGRVETRKWQDQSGADRYSTEVVIPAYRGEITMLGTRGDGEGRGDDGGGQDREQGEDGPREPAAAGNREPARKSAAGWDSGKGGSDSDDKIPF